MTLSMQKNWQKNNKNRQFLAKPNTPTMTVYTTICRLRPKCTTLMTKTNYLAISKPNGTIRTAKETQELNITDQAL